MKTTHLALATLLVACGDSSSSSPDGGPPPPDAGAVPLTYWQVVKPIIDAKCTSCHTEGGIAPFELHTYAQVQANHELIRNAVTTRFMPPWLAAEGCSEYAHDRSLDDAQIEAIRQWSLAGAAEGDASKPGAPIVTEMAGLSRADMNLELAAPYTMKPQADDYRCFVLDLPLAEARYVTGFRANPGNPAVVHHVIAFLAPPERVADVEALDAAEEGDGYTCFGGPGFESDWLGAWAPGSAGSDFTAGTGLLVQPGSKVVLQVHYNSANGGGDADQTSIDLRLDDAVDKVARIQPWANPNWVYGGQMVIPAGDPDVTHVWEQDLTVINGSQPTLIHSVGFHQHTRGTGGRVEILRKDGTRECLLDIPRWDFHWQGAYVLKTPRRFEPGDKIHLECHWDNSASEVDLNWGEGTGDEMCLTSFYITTP